MRPSALALEEAGGTSASCLAVVFGFLLRSPGDSGAAKSGSESYSESDSEKISLSTTTGSILLDAGNKGRLEAGARDDSAAGTEGLERVFLTAGGISAGTDTGAEEEDEEAAAIAAAAAAEDDVEAAAAAAAAEYSEANSLDGSGTSECLQVGHSFIFLALRYRSSFSLKTDLVFCNSPSGIKGAAKLLIGPLTALLRGFSRSKFLLLSLDSRNT